jgi:hypothetical protein
MAEETQKFGSPPTKYLCSPILPTVNQYIMELSDGHGLLRGLAFTTTNLTSLPGCLMSIANSSVPN